MSSTPSGLASSSSSRPRALLACAVLTLAFALLPSAPAAAQGPVPTDPDEEARYHFNLGEVAYNAGRFADAADEFEEAYRLSGRSTLLYNIFVARRDAGQLGPAIAALRKYLELVPDSEQAPALRRRLENMERIYSEQGAGQPVPPAPGETEPAEPASEPTAAPTPVPVQPSPVQPVAPARADGGQGGGDPSLPGIVLVSAGGGLIVGGIITGVLALQSENDLEDNCGDGPCPAGFFQDDIDRGRRRALLTDILIPVGVVTAGVGVALILLGVGADEDGSEGASTDPEVDIACGPTGCMGTLGVRF